MVESVEIYGLTVLSESPPPDLIPPTPRLVLLQETNHLRRLLPFSLLCSSVPYRITERVISCSFVNILVTTDGTDFTYQKNIWSPGVVSLCSLKFLWWQQFSRLKYSAHG